MGDGRWETSGSSVEIDMTPDLGYIFVGEGWRQSSVICC